MHIPRSEVSLMGVVVSSSFLIWQRFSGIRTAVQHCFCSMALLCAAFLGGHAMPASAQVELTFGAYADDKPSETVRQYLPFLGFLESRLEQEINQPVSIRLDIAKGYDESIRDLAEGRVDFARFGPASYVHAMDQNPGIGIIAMESKKGKKRFKGVIAVHKDSDITQVEELAGRTFAFGDELSTIGRYLSQSYLLDHGISSQNLRGFSYLGRHDLVGESVGSGRFDAGALKESTFKSLISKGVPLRVLASFDNVTKPWLAASDMDPQIMDAMRRIMLASENEEIVKRVSKNGFLLGSDSDYDIIRRAMQRSKAF